LGEYKAKELSDMQDKFMLEYQQNDGNSVQNLPTFFCFYGFHA